MLIYRIIAAIAALIIVGIEISGFIGGLHGQGFDPAKIHLIQLSVIINAATVLTLVGIVIACVRYAINPKTQDDGIFNMTDNHMIITVLIFIAFIILNK